ncbi:hypothetical protein H0H81_001995 [Sphagnurus paluster]|uniref:mRNA m(6)A methyltransferase n=1 Tax=Sphagnurus paluster TaxID=117069 RepID=A0A9P7KPH9_9AGAR|nr:hypothetical protein H0H81_001995 [Sphagnurus paluster]
MSDDELKVLAFTALTSLVGSRKVSFPISAMSLLARVVSFKVPSGLFAAPSIPNIRFSLTDLSRFEAILEDLSRSWNQGTILFSRENGHMTVLEITLNHNDPPRLTSDGALSSGDPTTTRKRKRVIDEDADSAAGDQETEDSYEELPGLNVTSTLASLSKEMREAYAILQASTARGRLLAEQFQSAEEKFEPICSHITKDECAKARRANPNTSSSTTICDRVHFRALIRPHTDVTLGHCSYLNTCYSEPTYSQSPSIPPFPSSAHTHGQVPPNTRGPVSLPSGLGAGGRGKEKAPCRYLHYEVDWDEGDGEITRHTNGKAKEVIRRNRVHKLGIGQGPAGKPTLVLPYGTMTDDEMRAMPIPTLQDEGLLFLWVTGRAMEVGRECMRVWGYTRVDEVIWVKTNQLQRVIRTGRTGHWLNHTKEHMLVGVKTVTDESGALKFPSWVNRGLDTDVIVSEVRETSRKPDEVYGLIERMCPGGRKIEVFGRKHNTRPGWLTLGNQLGPDQIFEEDLAARIKAK